MVPLRDFLVILLIILGAAIVAVPAFKIGVSRGREMRDLLISHIITEDPDGFICFIQSIKALPKDKSARIHVLKKEDQ